VVPKCGICNGILDCNEEFAGSYPGLVCQLCDERAVTQENIKAKHISDYIDDNNNVFVGCDDGDNPVFIDGIKCWRRYRFGGYVTMRDYHDCKDISEFYEKHFPR
jgi:hypothetical protein